MHAVITGYPPYVHDQIGIKEVSVLNPTNFCPTCGKLLTPEEKAKYAVDAAYCSECTWEMWRDISWRSK